MLLVVALSVLSVMSVLSSPSDDDAFGGASQPAAAAAPAPAEALAEDVCTIKGDDGIWRPCSEVLAAKKKAEEPAPPEDVDPETKALRARMKAADAAAAAAAANAGSVAPKTQLEIDIEKAHLDVNAHPLLQVRVEAARARDEVKRLESAGTGGAAKERAEERLAQATRILDAVERIALHRMDVCTQRRGNKPIVKNFKMTPAGPVMLTTAEMMRQLPLVDPAGCERLLVIDEKVVQRVKRREELTHTLATTNFGYHDIGNRKALEKELAEIEKELAKEAIPAMSAPGVRDPYGRR